MFELKRAPPPVAVQAARATLEPVSGRSMATVIARSGKADALSARVADLYDLTLPEGPQWSGGNPAFVGVGPHAWLAVSGDGAMAAYLQRDLSDLASIADQSSAYTALRLSGPGAVEVLSRHVVLDLHESAFKIGDAAVTNIGLINAILWKIDEAPVFEIAVFRSYTDDVWRDLSRSIENL